MKKILLVSHSQKLGGAERCLFEAAIGLRDRGLEVNVLLPSTGDLYNLLKESGIPATVSSYPWWVHFQKEPFGILGRLKKIVSHFKYTGRLMKVIRRIDPDIILSNTLCIPDAAITALLLRKKHYWFIHEFGKEDHGLIFDFGFYFSSKIIAATSERVLVNSNAVKQKFSKHIPADKIAIINYSISTPVTTVAEYRDATTTDLLLVGQISEPKGQMDAVKALVILKNKGYRLRLLIVGQITDQIYFEVLQKYIADQDIQNEVIIENHNPTPYSVLENFTIGLMCSAFEALGRVTIEYMKLGLPVIGANAGTTGVLIKDNDTGLLYELRNSNDLAVKIERMINDQALVNRLTVNARKFANDNFSTESYIGGLMDQLMPAVTTHGK